MGNDSLKLKLDELNSDLERIKKAINTAKYSDLSEIKDEIKRIEKDAIDKDLSMRIKMRMSKAKSIESLSSYYEKERSNYQNLQKLLKEIERKEDASDQLLLISEYALDYAAEVATLALLISLNAIEKEKEII